MFAITGCLSVCAAEPVPIELKGIVRFPNSGESVTPPDRQPDVVAVFEFPPRPQRREEFGLLGEGQRQGDLEVIKIDIEAGKVQARVNGESREWSLALKPTKGTVPSGGSQSAPAGHGRIWLENASRRQALEIYQRLVGRTLLFSGAITQGARLSLRMDPPAAAVELANGLENALDGLVFHPDGEKFTVIGREGDFEKLTPELHQFARNLKLSNPVPPGAQTSHSEDTVPAGMLNFQNTDFFQVLQIFQELVNRTLLRPARLSGSGVYLKTQTPLTRQDAVYALCAVLALDGLSFVDLGDKFLFVYPTADKVKRKALFARAFPSHTAAPGSQTIPPGTGNSWLDLPGVAKIYSELAGERVAYDEHVSRRNFAFRAQTPLTSAEALHALDLLLGWEGLEVVKSKDGTELKLVRFIEN